MFGHHGSKAAGNMVGKLLSFDLRDKGVIVAMIHVRHRFPLGKIYRRTER